MSTTRAAQSDLAAEIAAHQWYHTLELAPGVETPGWHDTRPIVSEIPFPASLEGKRCLDVGTFDGFWAFEMERRGAASVTAIDIEDPEDLDWPASLRADHDKSLDETKGERLVAFYSTKDVPPQTLWSRLSESSLPRLWIPKRDNLYYLDPIPMLGSGKVDRHALRAWATQLAEREPRDAS